MTFTPRALSSNSVGSDGAKSPRSPRSQKGGTTVAIRPGPHGKTVKSGTSTLTHMTGAPTSQQNKDCNHEMTKVPLRLSVDMFQAHMKNDTQQMFNTATTSLDEMIIAKQDSAASKVSSGAGLKSDRNDGKSIVSQSSLDFEERYRANMLS